jgi:hypothetical protein
MRAVAILSIHAHAQAHAWEKCRLLDPTRICGAIDANNSAMRSDAQGSPGRLSEGLATESRLHGCINLKDRKLCGGKNTTRPISANNGT